MQSTAALGATLALADEANAGSKSWAAKPPSGFTRMAIPGKVVRVHKAGSLQSNGVYPKQAAAKEMLERAMKELTGKSSLKEAFGLFVHPKDTVAIKPNGIAGKKTMKMATNKELVLEVVKAVMAVGVPAKNITVFEQYRDFLFATRCVTDKGKLTPAPGFPSDINMKVHLNSDAVMDAIEVGGVSTKYVTPFTDASVVLNLSQVKDHGICGYTGAMKNITHGCNINPHDFHKHNASPQIAHLYAQDVIKSRVALHITDGYQVIYDKGPIDRDPKRRVKHEAIYASTDPVAIDVIGWEVVEKLRKDNGLPSLKAVGREPTYLRVAGQLGLGVFNKKSIRFRDVSL
jgi:uncharacterized protein (DUF362 family)